MISFTVNIIQMNTTNFTVYNLSIKYIRIFRIKKCRCGRGELKRQTTTNTNIANERFFI